MKEVLQVASVVAVSPKPCFFQITQVYPPFQPQKKPVTLHSGVINHSAMQNSTANPQHKDASGSDVQCSYGYCMTLAHTGFARRQAACFGLSLRTTTNMLAEFVSSSSGQQR